MNFPDAIKSGFVNGIKFSGRAKRPEYWYFTLFYLLCYLPAKFAGDFGDRVPAGGPTIVLFGCLIVLLLFPLVPYLAVQTRRLHDTNHSGWWIVAFFAASTVAQFLSAKSSPSVVLVATQVFLSVASIVLMLILLFWLAKRGTDGPNRFGPPPAMAPVPEQSAPQV